MPQPDAPALTLMRHLSAAGSIDPLSGLADRNSLVADARRLLGQAAEDGLPVTLALFDLDRLSRINDAFGRGIGDRTLWTFGHIVRQHIRPRDIAGRFGGEEFVLVMPGAVPDGGMAVAERIRVAFAEAAATVDGHAVNATVSAGVAADRGNGQGFDALLDVAEGALCRAKNFGRDRTVLGKPKPAPEEATKVVVRVA